jgi:hypothetical protein
MALPRRPLFALPLALFAAPACDRGEPLDLDPQTLYDDAVADAADVEADEVVDSLVAIRPGSTCGRPRPRTCSASAAAPASSATP